MRGYITLLFTMLILAACGGGGGGGGGTLPQTPAPGALGSRAVPGYLLQVDCDGDLVAAAQRTISLDLQPDNGQLAPTLVEAAVGSTQPNDWVAGIPDSQHLRWTWTLTLPSDLANQRVWLRLTDADGNICQSGLDDFSLLR